MSEGGGGDLVMDDLGFTQRGHAFLQGFNMCRITMLDLCQGEKISQELITILAGSRIRMKLYAVEWEMDVLQSHNHATGGGGGDMQTFGQAGAGDGYGMITGGNKPRRTAGKHPLTSVVNV